MLGLAHAASAKYRETAQFLASKTYAQPSLEDFIDQIFPNTGSSDERSKNANRTLDVNAGYNPQPYFNYGLSSAPAANDVQTDTLGGDIQHIETDSNTNVEYEKQLSKQDESNVNWAESGTLSVGLAAAALGGALYLGAKN